MTKQHNTVLHTGATNDLERRVYEHKAGLGGGFTHRYNVSKPADYEATSDVRAAIVREKQIRGGSGRTKIDLVESMNLEWKDLSADL